MGLNLKKSICLISFKIWIDKISMLCATKISVLCTFSFVCLMRCYKYLRCSAFVSTKNKIDKLNIVNNYNPAATTANKKIKMRSIKKVFLGIISFVFICSSLNAQSQMSNNKERVRSILDGVFFNSKLSAHMPVMQSQSKPTSLMKAKQTESVKYQLDSLVLTPSEDGSGLLKSKINCAYDNLGRMTLFSVSQFDDLANKYELDYKYVYRYGSNYIIRDEYNTYNSPIHFNERKKTIYDQNNRILVIKEKNDTVDFEISSSREEYVYANNLLSMINSFSSNSIEPYQMTRYYYDSMDRDTAEVTFQKDYFNENSFVKYERVKYSYDTNNDFTNVETFDYSNGEWILDGKSDYVYNDNHNCTSYIESRSRFDGSVDVYKYLSAYNESLMLSDTYCGDTFSEFPYPFKSQLAQIDLSVLSGSAVLLQATYNLYYSQNNASTGIDHTAKATNEIVSYNAGQKTITLQNTELGNSNQLQLYSLSGKMVLNKSIGTSVAVDKLEKGLYIYKVISAGKTITGKIVVE